jgi:hypothetical protein
MSSLHRIVAGLIARDNGTDFTTTGSCCRDLWVIARAESRAPAPSSRHIHSFSNNVTKINLHIET